MNLLVSRRRAWLLPVGATMMVSGCLTALVGGWWIRRGLPEPNLDENGLKAWPVITGGLLVLWAIIEWRGRRRQSWNAEYDEEAPRRRRTMVAVAVLVGFCASAAWAIIGLTSQLSKGWAGDSTTVSAIGSVAGVIGVLLVTVFNRWPTRFTSRGRGTLAGVVAVSALLVAVAGGLVWVPGAGLTATTASPVEAPALADDLSEVAWQQEMPSQLAQVVAAGPGVVARVDDGVIAVDGRTGEERWRHQRDGAVATGVNVSPDGRTLVLLWSAGQYGQSQFVFLDAVTGRELHRADAEGSSLVDGFNIPMSEDAYIHVSEEDADVTGYSLRTGEQLWRYTASEGCTVATGYEQTVTDGPAIVPFECWEERELVKAVFVAFADSAEPYWEREIEVPEEAGADTNAGVSVWTPADGSSFNAGIVGTDPEQKPFALDFDTGEDRAALDYGLRIYSWFPTYEAKNPSDREDDRLEIQNRNGDVLGTVTTPCAGINSLVPSDSLVACLGGTWEDYESGRAEVIVSTYDGEQREIEVDLGGPYTNLQLNGLSDRLVRAPGAWIVWSDEQPDPGTRPMLVGLR